MVCVGVFYSLVGTVQFSSTEHLLSRAADFGSQRLWQPVMAASQGKARGILMWKLRMKISVGLELVVTSPCTWFLMGHAAALVAPHAQPTPRMRG